MGCKSTETGWERPQLKAYRQEEVHCLRVLCDYLHLRESWKVQYAPKTPEDVLDNRFVEACQMLDYVEYLTALVEDFPCASCKTERSTVQYDQKNQDGHI